MQGYPNSGPWSSLDCQDVTGGFSFCLSSLFLQSQILCRIRPGSINQKLRAMLKKYVLWTRCPFCCLTISCCHQYV